MPRFAASLSTMFTELPLPERFAAAARSGFSGVEIQSPYDHDPAELRRLADGAGVEVVLINLPAGDAARGERGLAGLPGREAAFEAALATGLSYAGALGSTRIHAMAGIRPEGASLEACEAALVANLARAVPEARRRGVTLLVEPINASDMPGYVVSRQDQGRRIVDAVAEESVRLQFDLYHCQRTEGDLARWLERQLPVIGHVQIADNPGRHEPGTGEIAFPFLFAAVDASGYAGWVGCEYTPKGETVAGLGWAKEWGIG